MSEKMREIESFQPRMARGLFVGAVAGAMIVTLPIALSVNLGDGFAHAFGGILGLGSVVFVCAFLVWFSGLVVVGVPSWLILHRLGYRGIVAACVLGFVATSFVSLAIQSNFFALPSPTSTNGATQMISGSEGPTEINYRLTRLGWKYALKASAELGAIGIAVAVAVWTTAYRPGLRWTR
jgi:hypothetical protein